MTRSLPRISGALVALCLAAVSLKAADVPLAVVQFPERSGIDVALGASSRVVPAEAEAEVKYRDGQADVEVEAKKLPPAILFGGDVTAYVVWAVSRDAIAENLGELIVKNNKADSRFRTGQKEFAILITAEPYALVRKPSDLVCFTSVAPKPSKAQSTTVTYSAFSPTPRIGNAQIGSMRYTGDEPIEIIQAQHLLEHARAIGAEKYAPDSIRQADTTLAQATNSYKAGDQKVGVDYARRSISLSSTAIRDTERNLAAESAAAAAAKEAAERRALEQQTAAAQAQAAESQQQALSAREQALAAREQAYATQQQLDESRRQAVAAQEQMATLQQQASSAQQEATAAADRAAAAGLSAEAAEAARREADDARKKAEELASEASAARAESDRKTAEVATAAAKLERQNAQLQQQNDTLVQERDDLAGQLDHALSSVAQITKTARGVVVNLPDILFDLNKATLKPNTQVALAKLAGIVELFPKINLRIEGYTDSTGTDELNMRLSRERAESVRSFLAQQGVASSRMTTGGYGPKFPVADNATAEGRAKNRRVEIVLAEGAIQGAGTP
jgi:outer membrane protein OmpA-like peptidoglycan-associated protein